MDEVYMRMVNPLVEDFLRGKSGMFDALGPSGSGKTHTVFGCPWELGMVPLILSCIFNQTEGINSKTPRSFFISMFEICSEKGEGERISDLLLDGGDICVQQSTIKELKILVEKYTEGDGEAIPLIFEAILKRKLVGKHEETDDEFMEELRQKPVNDVKYKESNSESYFNESDKE